MLESSGYIGWLTLHRCIIVFCNTFITEYKFEQGSNTVSLHGILSVDVVQNTTLEALRQ